MAADQGKHDKNVILQQHATLNPRPDGVTHPLFKGSEFFDPHDLLQVTACVREDASMQSA